MLTEAKIKAAEPNKKYYDRDGLMLIVQAKGTKSWSFKYQFNKKSHQMGLGGYPKISLKEARQKVASYKKKIAEGVNPILFKETQKDSKPFQEVALEYLEANKSKWRNDKHIKQWYSTLETYVYPSIGRLNIQDITSSHVLDILQKIWTVKHETAKRIRGRIEVIFDYATAIKYRTGENPARWKGNLAHILPKQEKLDKHYPALDYENIAEFMALLQKREGISAQALEFLILTATRSGEVRGAEWKEIDFTARLWIIPAVRMKAKKEHRIPLCGRAMEILQELKAHSRCEYVFESQTKKGKMLSDMTLSAVLKRMDYKNITVHGFRSTFRDWAGETTPFPREVIEHAMAHKLKDKAEAAYARGTLLVKRRELMKAWEKYIFSV